MRLLFWEMREVGNILPPAGTFHSIVFPREVNNQDLGTHRGWREMSQGMPSAAVLRLDGHTVPSG